MNINPCRMITLDVLVKTMRVRESAKTYKCGMSGSFTAQLNPLHIQQINVVRVNTFDKCYGCLARTTLFSHGKSINSTSLYKKQQTG